LLGVLPLVKASFLPLAVAAVALACVLFWRAGRKRLALLCLLLPLAAMLLAWRLAGQPLGALAGYVEAMSPLVSAFAEAMALHPPTGNWRLMQYGAPGMVGAYLWVAALLLAALWQGRGSTPGARQALLLLGVALYLFIAFKAAFVRFDAHALTAGSALLLLILLLRALELARIRPLAAVLALGSWAFAHAVYVGPHLEDAPLASLASALSALRSGSSLQSGFEQALQAIQARAQLPPLRGSADIYPHDLAALIASGNPWAPRPVPQSYSAYTPDLAARNAAHLRGPLAPDSVVFRIGPIDGRYPSLEDGPSWAALLARYAVSGQDSRYVYLQRQPLQRTLQRSLLLQSVQQMGQAVELPAREMANGLVFAQIDVQPTFLGRWLGLLFKPGALHVSVELRNGQSQHYRLVPGMARAGFVLSPLVQNNADFVQLVRQVQQAPLVQESRAAPQPAKVRRLRIGPAEGMPFSWQSAYRLTLWSLDSSPGGVAPP
jgi:hypothetical protein